MFELYFDTTSKAVREFVFDWDWWTTQVDHPSRPLFPNHLIPDHDQTTTGPPLIWKYYRNLAGMFQIFFILRWNTSTFVQKNMHNVWSTCLLLEQSWKTGRHHFFTFWVLQKFKIPKFYQKKFLFCLFSKNLKLSGLKNWTFVSKNLVRFGCIRNIY